jgi:hypothetical protein
MVVVLSVLAGVADAKRGSRLQTQAGVLVLGGTAGFTVEHVNPDGNAESVSGALFNFSPFFGGFVVRNLLIGGALAVEHGIGDLFKNRDTTVKFGFELRYLFNFRSRMVPYVGFGFGPVLGLPKQGEPDVDMHMGFPAGILIALNQHVAVNFGIRVQLEVGVSGQQDTVLRVPMGYLGVNSYF